MITRVWWSQTGSNRRPHACKARALPTELWPQATDSERGESAQQMVGLGRLELPTSRLSSARSNQLSYKPEPRQPIMTRAQAARTGAKAPETSMEERETKAASSRMIGLTGHLFKRAVLAKAKAFAIRQRP